MRSTPIMVVILHGVIGCRTWIYRQRVSRGAGTIANAAEREKTSFAPRVPGKIKRDCNRRREVGLLPSHDWLSETSHSSGRGPVLVDFRCESEKHWRVTMLKSR